VIAMKLDVATSDVRLFDAADLPWIEQLLEIVARCIGQPWRVLLERIEHAPFVANGREVSLRARRTITNALRRALGGRAERGKIARKLRASVLGHPALAESERAARIAHASAELGIEPADVEQLLWADLARERPVHLPARRPSARMLAELGNIERIQHELRRAHQVELRVWDNAHALVRMAARYGLIVRAVHEQATGAWRLAITGPLALFHATTIYGRALGALAPMLANHARFELAIHCDFASGPHVRQIGPPILLPRYVERLKPSPGDRLARDLMLREHVVDREPAPLVVGNEVVFPDLAIDHRGARWFVEIIGFSTAEYLADKLALYRAADANVILCIDAKRSVVDEHPNVVPYARHVDADSVVERIEAAETAA
jgi:predicted nuclease of restriction endonuclease-like RecB superfamily